MCRAASCRGGGSVFLATSRLDWRLLRPCGAERFEDGTVRPSVGDWSVLIGFILPLLPPLGQPHPPSLATCPRLQLPFLNILGLSYG